MEWIRSHPYIASLIAAGVLILVGVAIVEQRAAVQPIENGVQAWGSAGGNPLNPIATTMHAGDKTQSPQDLMRQIQGSLTLSYTPAPAPSGNAGTASTDTIDWNGFLAALSHGAPTSSAAKTGGQMVNPYSFIPSGFLSTASPAARTFTDAQQALYEYGNEVGGDIQAFEGTHANMATVLRDQFEDPQNPQKKQALGDLARALSGVGDTLASIDTMPEQARAANAALAASYRDMGEKLSLIPQAQSTQDRVNAMLTYDKAADGFTKQYVALATLFSISGVTFSENDPGSVFTFTQMSL